MKGDVDSAAARHISVNAATHATNMVESILSWLKSPLASLRAKAAVFESCINLRQARQTDARLVLYRTRNIYSCPKSSCTFLIYLGKHKPGIVIRVTIGKQLDNWKQDR